MSRFLLFLSAILLSSSVSCDFIVDDFDLLNNPKGGSVIALAGGDRTTSGHVKVTQVDTLRYGYVCDDLWDEREANVVCRQLGFERGFPTVDSLFGSPSDNVFVMDDVNCSGNEDDILSCAYPGWAQADCGTGEAAGVICVPFNSTQSESPSLVTLAFGNSTYGLVVVTETSTGRSGYVCSDQWDNLDASVICRQMGFTGGKTASVYVSGSDNLYVAMAGVDCAGTEENVFQCPYYGWGIRTCSSSFNRAGVSCY